MNQRFYLACIFLLFFCHSVTNGQDIQKFTNPSNEISLIQRNLQNSFLRNDFISCPEGNWFLRHSENIYQSCNKYGDSWCQIIKGNLSLAIDPKNPKIYYTINSSFEVSKSMNAGESWILIQNGLPYRLHPQKIMINPHNTSEVFLQYPNEIYKTSDAGFSWQLFKNDITPQHFIIDFNKENKFYILSNNNLFLSIDAGITWKNIGSNLPKVLVKGTGRTAVNSPAKILSIIDVNFQNTSYLLIIAENGIFKTNDDGNTLIEINDGISKSFMHLSAFLTDNEIFIGGSETNNLTDKLEPVIYKSDVLGTKWNKIKIKDENFKESIITGIVKDITRSGIFIQASNGKIAYLDTSLNVIGLNYGMLPHSQVGAFDIARIGNENIQYANIYNNNFVDVENYGIWQSRDNGLTWKKQHVYENYKVSVSPQYKNIFISPLNLNETWLSDFVTYDGGNSWLELKQLNIRNISNLQFDIQNNKVVYLSMGVNEKYLYRFDKLTSGFTNLCESGRGFVVSKDDSKKILTAKGNISLDGGWTWQSLIELGLDESIMPLSIKGSRVTMAHKKSWYSGSGAENWMYFLISDDAGKSWSWKGEKHSGFTSLCVNKHNPSNIIMAKKTKPEEYASFDKLVVYESIDDAKNWNPIFTLSKANVSNYVYNISDYAFENLLDNFIISIFIDQVGDKNTIYLGLSTGGMICSIDHGKTWKKLGGIQ